MAAAEEEEHSLRSLSFDSGSNVSFRSSVMEFDDDEEMYRRTQSEYEEIPDFRWIPSPLRWWKIRKRAHPAEKSAAAGTAGRGGEPEPTRSIDVESGGETRTELVHFDGHPAFTYEDLMTASTVLLGEGTYGTLYRATLDDGNQVAVRMLTRPDIARELNAEVNMLGKIRHPNLLALRAYCGCPEGEKSEQYLVFDYMPRGGLSTFLHGRLKFVVWKFNSKRELHEIWGPDIRIDWQTRMNIAFGIARGLHHLHTQKNMVHGHLTSASILLDDHTNAKITDYGLSHLMALAANSNAIAAAEAFGYCAPELSKLEEANTKTDVYSLGVIMLELLTGKSPREAMDGGVHLIEWTARFLKKAQITEVFDPDLRNDAYGTMGNEMRDTLYLALLCVDPSPDARPEVQQVLQQLEKIKPELAGAICDAVAEGGINPTNASLPRVDEVSRPEASQSIPISQRTMVSDLHGNVVEAVTIAVPTTDTTISSSCSSDMSEERIATQFEDAGEGTSTTPKSLPNGSNHLGAQMPTPVNSCTDQVQELGKLTSNGDQVKEGENTTIPRAREVIEGCSGNEGYHVSLTISRPERDNPASIPGINSDEAILEDKIGKSTSTEKIEAMSGDGLVVSIDWAEITMEAHLQVPASPPLITSHPDAAYQRYFQVLYDLAHRSPPLPSNALEVQLNRMIIGLQSLGYPLDTWLKAATNVLVSAKKREYIEHHMDGHKAEVEAQMTEVTSAIAPVREEISRMQSDISTLERKRQEINETITKLEGQLVTLKTQQEEIVNSLAMAGDQLGMTEVKMGSMVADMDGLKQKYAAISDLRTALLRELPSLDDVFRDSSFQEIMTKKF